MIKYKFLVLVLLLLFSLSSCSDNSDKKMKGFTHEELAEYLSSIEGLDAVEAGEEFIIPCGGNQLYLRESIYLIRFNTKVFPDCVFTLRKNRSSEYFPEYGGFSEVPIDYHAVLSITPNSVEDSVYMKSINYLGEFPDEFAYYLYECKFKSSPHWTEWVQYHIPRSTYDLLGNAGSHGQCNELWYNPSSEQSVFGSYKPQIRKSCTRYATIIKDNRYEGQFSPRVSGKRISKNVYAKT